MSTRGVQTDHGVGAAGGVARLRPPGAGRTQALFALALAAALACAPRAQRTAATAPAPPPKLLFEPYPVASIATVRDPHDHQGKPLCQRCHVPTGELIGDPVALCSGCHKFHLHSHPVGVVQKDAVDLPLRSDRKVACHTCHDPHQKKQKLRKPFNKLCITCHQRH